MVEFAWLDQNEPAKRVARGGDAKGWSGAGGAAHGLDRHTSKIEERELC